jgi:hypothetical protein
MTEQQSTEKRLSPRDLTTIELRFKLLEIFRTVQDRLSHLAGGGDVYWVPTVIVIEHAEEVLADDDCQNRVEGIARFGRVAEVRLHLIFDRPVGKLTLGDYGTSVLRSLLTTERGGHIVSDTTGRTLQEVLAAQG